MLLNGIVFDTLDASVKKVPEKDIGINIEDFEVNHGIVMKVVKGFYKIHKLLLDPKRVKKTFVKLQSWFDSFEGNDEEGAIAYVNNEIVKVMGREANSHLTEPNILMMRYVFFTINNKNGEKLFDILELMILTMAISERDGFYQFEIDNDFMKIVYQLADSDEDELNEVIAQAIIRLEIRTHLATLIMTDEKRKLEQGQPFDITDDATWIDCRFSRITLLLAEKL